MALVEETKGQDLLRQYQQLPCHHQDDLSFQYLSQKASEEPMVSFSTVTVKCEAEGEGQ